MYRVFKILGVLAVLFSTADRASALSFVATGTSEFYSITNMSGFSITGDVNIIAGLSGPGGATVFTTSPFTLINGQSFTTLLSNLTTGAGFRSTFDGGGSGSPTSFSESVSAVPLPAGFPLFALGLVMLACLGYFGVRNKRSETSAIASA